jgi:hypothetical protein
MFLLCLLYPRFVPLQLQAPATVPVKVAMSSAFLQLLWVFVIGRQGSHSLVWVL